MLIRPVIINTNLITIISVLFGILGIGFGIYQIITAQKVKKLYESYCRIRCKNIVDLTRDMAKEVISASRLLNYHLKKTYSNSVMSCEQIGFLAAKINGVRLLTLRLRGFCESLHEEHQDQFRIKIFGDIQKELPDIKCLEESIDPKFLVTNNVPDNHK